MIKEKQTYLNRFLIITDFIVIILSFIFAWYLRFKIGQVPVGEYFSFALYLKPVACVIPVYLILYSVFNLYTPYRFKSLYEEFINIIKANMLGVLIFIGFLFLFKEIDYSRYLLFIFTFISIIFTTFERAAIRLLLRDIRKKGYNIKHILLVGDGELAQEFLLRIKKNTQWGYNVLGIVHDSEETNTALHKKSMKAVDMMLQPAYEEVATSVKAPTYIGNIGSLEHILQTMPVDEVFITLRLKEYEKLGYVINQCEKNGIRTQIIPDYYRYIPAKPYVEELDGLPVINIRYIPLDSIINKLVKRGFDIVVSSLCIIIFSPIMLFLAFGIKLSSKGPVFFHQERIGLNNKSFIMYKFRSMKMQCDDEEKCSWTTKNDPRKTKFGNFIRKTSLDELPQFLNVLRGDMSIIGPRPERPHFVDKFRQQIPKYMVKHQVRPGITGWAQVNGWRGDTSIEKRIEYDIYYIENWSFGMDIKILCLTLVKGFFNKNAY